MNKQLLELLDEFVQNYCANKYENPYDDRILDDEVLQAVDVIQNYLEDGEI